MVIPFRRTHLVSVVAAALVSGACSYKLTAPALSPPAGPSAYQPALVAMLAPVDMRKREGGVKTHTAETVPGPSADPYWNSPYPYPLDPWNSYYSPPAHSPPSREVRLKPTGVLATEEVLEPLVDSFSARLRERLGAQVLRDATADPLAELPDPSRALAFLSAYPVYDAAVWVEVLAAKAQLPEHTILANAIQLTSICSLGGLAWLYLVPVDLETPVELRARAFLIRRSSPSAPLGAAIKETMTVKAKGSVAFDVDSFRADVGAVAGGVAGTRLADQLLERVPESW